MTSYVADSELAKARMMTDIAWELAVQLEVYRPCLVFRLVFGSSSGLPCSHVENGELFWTATVFFSILVITPGDTDNSESASQVNIASFFSSRYGTDVAGTHSLHNSRMLWFDQTSRPSYPTAV